MQAMKDLKPEVYSDIQVKFMLLHLMMESILPVAVLTDPIRVRAAVAAGIRVAAVRADVPVPVAVVPEAAVATAEALII